MTNAHAPLPKTLIIDLSTQYGGSNSRVLALMEKFPLGQIALACLLNSPIHQQAMKRNLTVYPVAAHKADPRILLRLCKIIKHGQYKILDTQNIQSKFWGSIAALITKSALVSTLNSWYANEHGGNSLKGKIYTLIELKTNFCLDRYITVSSMDRQSLLNSGFRSELVDLIHNAIEVDAENIHRNAKSLKEKFNLPDDAIVCIAVGRLVWAKGYDYLIKAFTFIAEQNSRLHCLIVGDGELFQHLSNQISEAGLEKRVLLIGYQEHDVVLSLIKSSDFFVLPSEHEGTPIALLEAAALERPIIATRCGGIPEVVKHGKQALLVPIGDVQALASALLKFANDQEYANELGKNAKIKIQTDFSLNAQVEATKQAYIKAWENCQQRLGSKRRK